MVETCRFVCVLNVFSFFLLTMYFVILHAFCLREHSPQKCNNVFCTSLAYILSLHWWCIFFVFSGRTHNASFSLYRIGGMASQGLKKFVETSSADELDESSQGADGIFDAFNGAPIPAGVGQTETQFFLDGNHTLVMNHVSNYFIRYCSGSEIVDSPINYC